MALPKAQRKPGKNKIRQLEAALQEKTDGYKSARSSAQASPAPAASPRRQRPPHNRQSSRSYEPNTDPLEVAFQRYEEQRR